MFITSFPPLKTAMLECINFSITELEQQLLKLTEFETSIPLSRERVSFIIHLIQVRLVGLKQVLSEV